MVSGHGRHAIRTASLSSKKIDKTSRLSDGDLTIGVKNEVKYPLCKSALAMRTAEGRLDFCARLGEILR